MSGAEGNALGGEGSAQEAVFAPVRPPTTFEETVERLGTAIRLGLLAPGSRLPPERELAGELAISRSTLRQALTTLIQSGHLVSRRGRGRGHLRRRAAAARRRPRKLLDEAAWAILDYRVAIEAGAVLLAAERANAEQLSRLEELIARMAAADDFEEYRRFDIRFHIGLAEAAGSPRLVTAMTEVQGQMSDLIALIAHPTEVLTRSNDQHRRLVMLLGSGDAAGAVRLLREHIEGTEHIIAGLLPGPARSAADALPLGVEERLGGDLARDPAAEDLDRDLGPRLGAVGRQVGVGDRARRRCSRSRRSSPGRRSHLRRRPGPARCRARSSAGPRGSGRRVCDRGPRSLAPSSASRPMKPPSLSSLTQKPTPPS